MRKGVVVGVVGLLVAAGVAVLVPTYLKKGEIAKFEKELQDQLAAARREGIPTSPAEYEASLPKVKPEDNAAPVYEKLAFFDHTAQLELVEALTKLSYSSSPTVVSNARKLIAARSRAVTLLEEAATYPALRVDRNWEEGFAVLAPELGIARGGARLLLLRATLAAPNRPEEAIQDVKRAQTLASHMRIDGADLGPIAARSTQSTVVGTLASWAIRFPKHRRSYVRELESTVENLTPYEPKNDHRTSLFSIFLLMDMAQTEKGRRELGITPNDYENQQILGDLISRKQSLTIGKSRVVKGFRQMWAALSGPQDQIDDTFDKGRFELLQGMLSAPVAANLYESLSGNAEIEVNVLRAQATDILYRGLLRALQGSEIPKSIKTDDLISPLDGKPIRYQFDGKQITLDAGKGYGTQLIQKFPPGPPTP